MSTHTNRDTAAVRGRAVEHRLPRLLDTTLLTRVVPHLAPETLHQLIQRCGLDACGELVTAATPAQLTSLLDLDLWRHVQPGRDERFDVDRFGEWVEVLVDTGDSAAARTVAGLDKQLVIAGLSSYLRVFDPGTFEPTEATDDEPLDRDEMMRSETSPDVLECEVGGYLVRARRTDVWHAIVALLVALETEHTHYFHVVMRGCRRLSNSRPEVDGLDDLLMASEQHLLDVAIERERRRSRQGYAASADARAFLQMARTLRVDSRTRPIAINPIITACFRAADEEADHRCDGTSAGALEATAHSGTTAATLDDNDDPATSIDAVIELLTEAGVVPERPQALLRAADEDPGVARAPVLQRLTEHLLHHDASAYLARSRELGFLANTLLAGCSVQSRPFTPREASAAAACICNLGLECWPSRWPGGSSQGTPLPEFGAAMAPDTFLVDHDLVTAFEVGWCVLYEDVSLFVADRLVSTLGDLRVVDSDTRRGLFALQRTLLKQRQAGTPWLAREAAEVLALIDMTAWISVIGLLDECPILPAALTAILERRTSSVSATAFEFISTTAQIGDVRVFMRALPSVLSG